MAVLEWSNGKRPISVRRVTIVTVSYNTLELTAFLLWSLHRVLDSPDAEVVIVDNGSIDGSGELLSDAQDAGLCVLLVNDRNVGHGRALNQALSFLSSRPRLLDRVWDARGSAGRRRRRRPSTRTSYVGFADLC